MMKAKWMAWLTIGTLLPAAGSADEAVSSNDDANADVTFSVEALQAEIWRESRWHLLSSNDSMILSNAWPQTFADFDFQDNSTLGIVSDLESLSLLTLAEFGQTRLFLGIDDDGLPGLHFNIFPSGVGERQLEVVRMPYLKDDASDEEDELVGPSQIVHVNE